MIVNSLTAKESDILLNKATEPAFTGEYWDHFEDGIYVCRQCGQPLFDSAAKFDAQCGWPSFEKCFPEAVKEQLDAGGDRTEITCAKCGGHLGHVFRGEKFTPEDTRHCVNSLSIKFQPERNSTTHTKNPLS